MNEPVNGENSNKTAGTPAGVDYRQRALAIGIELAKNAVRAPTLEELQFILVNDSRALLEFDRSFLITHFEGKSVLDATNNQPTLEKKSEFVQSINKLAPKLREVRQGLVLLNNGKTGDGVSPESAAALAEYMNYSGCSYLIIVPFIVHDSVIAHLALEFFDNRAPGQVELLTLLNMVPFLSLALAEKGIIARDPKARLALMKAISPEQALRDKSGSRFKIKVAIGAILVVIICLFVPITLVVGGRAELTPEYEYSAFVQMDGIVDKVLIKEGDSVKKDQTLAELESREIDYKTREAKRLLESYRTEMSILRNLGAENPMKLAESQLIAIKLLRAQLDVDFLNWQSRYLTVKSPVDGIILTKKVESLVGRRFKAGEPFCRVAPHDVLLVDVFVRESDVNFVHEGLKGEVFFNYQPDRGFQIQVKTVAPKSETVSGMGGVFRVRTALLDQPQGIRPGMLGIAHIDTQKVSLWFALTRRLRIKINETALFF